MSIFHVLDPMGEYTAPLPQGPSPGDNDWNSQVAIQEHHAFPPGQATSTWHGFHSNNQSDAYSTNISGARMMQHTLSGDGNSPYSIEHCSQYGGPGSYDSNTSYSGSGSIDPRLAQKSSPSQYPHQIWLTGMPQVASPGQLTTAASSPASLHHQSASPAQATGYAAEPASSYFYPNPNYPQSSARQRQRPASSPQGWELCSSPNAGGFALSPRPTYQPTRHDENRDAEADRPGPVPHLCRCGAKFGRPTDLERHRNTSKAHNKRPRGPACPVDPCNHPSKFTREDNFKAHLVNQHGVSRDKADAFLREWRDRGRP